MSTLRGEAEFVLTSADFSLCGCEVGWSDTDIHIDLDRWGLFRARWIYAFPKEVDFYSLLSYV